ncbi:HEPN domain-containing protein [Actinosynnema sp. NPDC053489]|uniref:HEPN domain-containing protein n=1 Tax=Actinosynnema sp. NPDC053489 TaxID=3363916 RepID=UPI0037C6D74D
MPALTPADQVALHISTLKKAGVQSYTAANPSGRHPFPLPLLMKQVVSDRLMLAGEQLGVGDHMLNNQQFRSSISRHYYAMYHAARAVVFAVEQGDDYERHNELPRHLPQGMPNVAKHEISLTEARLLRNQADYDPYPVSAADWETDARALAATAAQFVNDFESFAITNGYV